MEFNNDIEQKAKGLLGRINRLETGIYTAFWNDLLQRVDATYRSLQNAKLDLNTAVVSLTSLRDFISAKRDSFENYKKQGQDLKWFIRLHAECNSTEAPQCSRLGLLDYGRAEEAQLTTEPFVN